MLHIIYTFRRNL